MNARPGGYVRPVSAKISSSFDDHRRRTPPSVEPGTDYACAYGTTIYAAEDGVVSEVRNTTIGAPGRAVGIKLTDGYLVRYLHLSRILVKVGEEVKRGQAVAYSGSSAWGREWGVGAHVHVSLWAAHEMSWNDKTIDFEPLVGPDNDNSPAPALQFEQVVADRQAFLNSARGEKLVVDGLNGRNTKAAVRRYQTYLKSRGWYSGPIDGIWGQGTQAGHERYWRELNTKPVTGKAATVSDLAKLRNVRGLQKIAKLYGYTGRIDNVWGPGSRGGFQRFLDQNHGGSLATWLRSRWGYKDRDDIWGPNMTAAAQRAEAANFRAL